MKDLKEALINKSTIKRAHTGGFLADAKNFKLSDLKEGYILVARNTDMYVVCPITLAKGLFQSNLVGSYAETPYVFVRKRRTNNYGYMELESYPKFPHNKFNSERDIASIYINEKSFKDTDDIKTYLDELPTIIANIK